MKIEQLMDKERKAQYQILSHLYKSSERVTQRELLEISKLSKVTLLKYLENINDLFRLEQMSAYISFDNDAVIIIDDNQFTWQQVMMVLLKDSIPYKLLRYFFTNENFNATFLAQKFLISEPTFNRYLAHINACIEEFDISIYQGKQTGSELQWRYFYYELFQLTLTEQEQDEMTKELDFEHLNQLVERFIGSEIAREQLEQLSLWLTISQKRFHFQKEKGFPNHFKIDYIDNNIFYKRLDRLMLHYLSRYAIEFDRFESKSLFMFLHSNPILPIHSMEFILGFGGPIADKISEALWLLRKANIISNKAKEEIIYGLSLYYSKAFFFKGAILGKVQSMDALYQLLPSDEKDKMELVLRHLFVLIGNKKLLNSDFSTSLKIDLLELLVFSIERQHKPLVIGLDFGSQSVKKAIVGLSIGKYLDNNKNYHFETYNPRHHYDCVLSYGNYPSQTNYPHFHLKSYVSPAELNNLQLFLEKKLKDKNSYD
ncbi:DNA-binding protein [Streptococcus porcinus]|uniref:helix-turn-helix domain-containing protein n=1 Tax=Streptococcus porcinus TaxID=1340 RepID=UPI0010CAC173|nr:helix-turn-helix domain-containing protein [Streptococcus porcinus]VTS42102.1 DNA-binding protein [Streptococcus porcinus]